MCCPAISGASRTRWSSGAEPVQTRPLAYERALDGVRALAVLAVLVFHAQPSLLPGGFVGVDVFFVLSGYLITRILLDDVQQHGHLRLRHFWWRRWWRLGPALVLLLLAYGTVVVMVLPPEAAQARGRDLLLAATYLSNWARAWQWHALPDLGHTWSLAVEMQFYLLWPLLLMLVLRLSRRTGSGLWWVVGLAVMCWLWRWHLQAQGASLDRLYNGTDTRAETLLWGAALACLRGPSGHRPVARWARAWPAGQWVAPLVLLAMVWRADWTDPWFYRWGITIVSAMSVLWIDGLMTGDAPRQLAWLRWGPLVTLGQMSYGVYLWHFPIIRTLLHWELSGWALLAGTVLLTLLAASVSRRCVELPLLAWRDRQPVHRP